MLASILALLLGVGSVVGLSVEERAEAAGPLTVTAAISASNDGSGNAFVVAGDPLELTVNVSNSGSDLYNAAFTVLVPVGLTFVSGGSLLSEPRVIGSEAMPDGPAEGFELWVWEDIADLPAGASLSDTIAVQPAQPTPDTGTTDDPAVFPVGSEVNFLTSAYASSDARLLPLFPGSTGAATNDSHNATGTDALVGVPVRAIDVEKSEPSPERELLRGVHDQHTTYTITVRNTTEGATDDVIVVDYLPAGLEYLGGGGADNSAPGEEYEDSGRISGAAPSAYREASTVETIVAGPAEPGHLEAGAVYTKVTWNLGTLSAGHMETIEYLAAVPLHENTMNFAGGTPGTGGEQAANLDNNSGPSTREGSRDEGNPGDGVSLTNSVAAAGHYTGVVRHDNPTRAVEDSARVTVSAEDLAIYKTAPDAPFHVGGDANWTLTIRSGEYTTASGLQAVDVLPDGLFPRLPADLEETFAGHGLPTEWFHESHPAVIGAEVTGIEHDPDAGTTTLIFTPTGGVDPFALQPNAEHTIVYNVGMRASYEQNDSALGRTTAGDTFTNTVELAGVTSPIDGIGGDPLFVRDVSSATMESTDSGIRKDVATRDSVVGFAGGIPMVEPDGWVDGDTEETTPGGFAAGDVVVYRMQVQFPTTVDTRNPQVTDMMPPGVSYLGWAYGPGNTVAAGEQDNDPLIELPRLEWSLGATRGVSDDLFVERGSLFEVLVWGEVTHLSEGTARVDSLDKPENLAKYRYENVDREVFFSRDQAATLTEPGISLLKGVAAVGTSSTPSFAPGGAGGDGANFNSNRDGVRVVQSDEVTYRIDLSAPKFATEDIVVWDALPVGISADDVKAGSITVTPREGGVASFTHQVFDPTDPDYPSGVNTAVSGSIVVWTIAEMAASTEVTNAGLTIEYTVTVPVGVYVDERLDNTASVVRYGIVSNTSVTENVTIVPDSALSTLPASSDPGDRELSAPGAHTNDNSWVQLPPVTIEKSVHDTELDVAQNDDGQAVQGEYVTYRYSLTVPAHTTIPAGSTLADDGRLARNTGMSNTVRNYVQHGAAALVSSDHGADYTLDADGALTFDSAFDNTSDVDVVFTIQIEVYTDGNGFAHNNSLYNRATFTNGDSGNSLSDTAMVQYREIAPTLSKIVNGGGDADVTANQTVEFELTASNPANRPTSYDTIVADCVPAELQDVTILGGATGATVTPGGCSSSGSLVTWDAGDLAPGTSATLGYSAVVDPESAGLATYTNVATLTGTTLPGGEPDREGTVETTADATVRVVPAVISKAVAPDTGTIGDEFDYTVTVELPENVNFHNAQFKDQLPAGLELIGTPTPVATFENGDPADLTFTPEGESGLSWTVNSSGSTDGVRSDPVKRFITITYEARMVEFGSAGELPVAGDTVVNSAMLSWNTVEGDDTTQRSVNDDATVTVVEPVLEIIKNVNGRDDDRVSIDESFEYSVTVANVGSADAHSIVVTDDVPAGVLIDPDTIPNGGVLAGADSNTGGGTITWNLDAPLAPGANLTLTYVATFAEPEHLDPASQTMPGWWANTAAVTHYESHRESDHSRSYDPEDLTDTARVLPLFPFVELEKVVGSQGATAFIGESFEWRLNLRNTGAGSAQTVTAVDTLPENWAYDAGSAMVSIAGSTAVPLADPTIDGRALTWAFGEPAPAAPVLPGAVGTTEPAITITFTATPLREALTAPGIGSGIDHTNTLTARTTDATGSPSNRGGDYVGPDSEAAAQIHVADLDIAKVGAAKPLVAGEPASTGWELTVTNGGPDRAVGPFTVTDVTDPLPAGVTVTGFTGSGWSLVNQTTDTDGRVISDFSYGSAATTLVSGASLPALALTVRVDASFDPADVPSGAINNIATVSSPTHDDDPSNNEDGDPIGVITVADLTLDKEVTTAAPNAGAPIAWDITVTNMGPSVSRSGATPITVTDVIPAGVTNVSMPTLPVGWASNIPAGGGLSAGDTLILTQEPGGSLGVGTGASVTFTVTADILSSHLTGTLSNTAEVSPGDTSEPDPNLPNDDTSATPVGDRTSIDVSKTRVVQDTSGDWVPATDPIVSGESVTYRIVVANSGPADAVGVEILDTLVAGLEAPVSHTSLEGSWAAGSSSPAEYSYRLEGNLAADESASLLVTATAVSGLSPDDEAVNHVHASATNDPDGDEDEDRGAPVRVADLLIEKHHDPAVTAAVAGQALGYTLTVTNLGPSYATGPVTVTDTLPDGFSYLTGSATVNGAPLDPVVSGQELTWTIGDSAYSLADGDTITIALVTSIAATVNAGDHLNTATVDSPDDTDPTNDTTTDVVPVVTSTDVTISKTAASGPHIAGGSVTYMLTVENHGPSVARNVTVTDVPEAGLAVTAMSGLGWDCTVATATCAFDGELPLGESSISVTTDIASWVPDGAALDNEATVRWTDSDGPHDDDDIEPITVTAIADLSMMKSLASETLDAGQTGRYRLDITNDAAASDAVSVTVTDRLPEGLSYVGGLQSEDSAWTYVGPDSSGDPVFSLGGNLVAGGSTWLEFDVSVHEAVSGEVTNVAIVQSPTDPEAPSDDETVTVGTTTNLVIVKERAGYPADARIGDATGFLITVRNEGPATATGVTVTDALPHGLTFEGITTPATGSGWTFGTVDDTLTASLGNPLPVGATASFTVTALVQVSAYAKVENTATVAGDNIETTYDDNESSTPIPVAPQVDLGVTKELVTDELKVGEQATYRLTVTNHGHTEDPGPITVRDELPEGLGFVEGENGCSASGNLVECELADTLAVDESVVIELTVNVLASAHPEVVNTASVHTSSEDMDPENNASTVVNPVIPDVRFAIEKSVVANDDHTITWRIAVSSVGLSDATNGVEITDTLPDGLDFVSARSHDGFDCDLGIDGAGTVVCTHPGVIPAGDSVIVDVVTTAVQEYGVTVTNHAEVTDGFISVPDEPAYDTADHMRALPWTGGGPVMGLAVVALLALLAGGWLMRRGRQRDAT